ncbi:mevalonate kinase [Microbacterium protaetiae]|uniref:Mevalonate kinase n=1 Tax=Microbacterium protaetiae TaxID=2509458 RepID=A0A4P6EDY9_9MICO|nr:mevalonate kinase [Microbacterium protaetiae]QAY60492.1 mevalonate kinase [Microbacterium protaetiae]
MAGVTGRVWEPSTRPASTIGAAPAEATATAHAKVILLGEHAVVHGAPAIALPVHGLALTATVTRTDRPLWIDSVLYRGPIAAAPELLAAPVTAIVETLRHVGAPATGRAVRIDGEIPAERGLGSSAAVAAAIAAAVARSCGVELDAAERFALIQAAERVAHGTPSGLDARSVVSDTPVWFQAGQARELPSALGGVFVIADTGLRGRTREAVAGVAALKAAEPDRVAGILSRIQECTQAAVDDLAGDDRAALGARMSQVHALLRELTVSNPHLDRLVASAEAAGALGAKLTGGGRGGCVLALAETAQNAETIAAAMRENGAERTWMLRPEETTA